MGFKQNNNTLYDNFTITQLESIYLLDPVNNTLECIIEEPQNASISNDQQTTELTGKQGRLLGTLKTSKSATITATNGIISGKAMAKQVGGEYRLDDEYIMLFDTIQVQGNAGALYAVTSHRASGQTGYEILGIGFAADGAAYMPLAIEQGTDFTYIPNPNPDVSDGRIEFINDGDLIPGDTIIVQYNYQVKAGVLVNESDSFSKVTSVVINAIARDTCMKEYYVQFHFPRGDVSGTFELAMGDAQTVQNLEINSIATGCGVGTNYLWKMVVVGLEQ